MRSYRADLVGLGELMQDQAPNVRDHTLMALGELLEVIGREFEEEDGDLGSDALIRAAYRCGLAWLLNQERS